MPKVTNKQNDKDFEVSTNSILYDALDDQGEQLPHGCLSGSCGACKVEILNGTDGLDEPGFIENNTLESIISYIKENNLDPDIDKKVLRLSCRAVVKGDVEFSPYIKDKK